MLILIQVIIMSLIAAKSAEVTLLNSSIMSSKDKWRIVNDDVMGGKSSSVVAIKNNEIIFSGSVSLKNNGGFASLRSPVKDYNFEGYEGIELKIKGDGKLYSISMKETTYFTGQFYTANFKSKKDEWVTLQIPFDKFKLYYFGRETNSDKKVPLPGIKEISFLIGDKQEGDFQVLIDYINLY